MFSRETVILECAATRVALGVFRWRGGRLRLLRHAQVHFSAKDGDADAWLGHVEVSLRTLREQAGRAGPCMLVVPAHLVLTKFLRLPRLERVQRGKVIRFEAEQSLPVALNDLVWDSAVCAEHESSVEVMLAAIHRSKMEALCAAVRAAGFEPEWAMPASLAILGAFRLAPGQPRPPSVLIHRDGPSTIFVLVEAGRFVLRTSHTGPARPPTGDDSTGVDERATRLAQEFTRSLLFFRQQGGGAEPGQIHLSGEGAENSGLVRALAEKLKVPVTPFDLSGTIDVIAPAEGWNAGLLELAGAAAAWRRERRVLPNLLPSGQRQPGRSRRLQVAGMVGALALTAISIPYFSSKPTATVRPPAIVQAVPAAPTVAPAAAADLPRDDSPEPQQEDHPFGVELIEVVSETQPYRLQLVGYVGEPGDYLAMFVSPDQPRTLWARVGQRFEAWGLTLRSFEVKKIEETPEGTSTLHHLAGFAVVHDEKTGEEVVLDSRRRKVTTTSRAVLRFPAGAPLRPLHEGETLAEETATYRIDRIQVDPPEVIVAKLTPGDARVDRRVLQPRGRSEDIAARPLAAAPSADLAGLGSNHP